MVRIVKLLMFLPLTGGVLLGGQARGSQPVTPMSDARPGKADAAPGTLAIGQYVRGRLGSDGPSRTHYWAAELQPGKYLIILDTHRSDERDAHVSVAASWAGGDGGLLATTNSPFGRDRGVAEVTIEQAGRKVLKVENRDAMTEYQLALVKADTPFSNTWLLEGSAPRTIVLGEAVTTPELDGESVFARDAFYLVTLPEGDFKLSSQYKATGEGSHCGVELDSLTLAGVDDRSLIHAFGTDKQGCAVVKVMTADEATMLLRVRAKGCKQVTRFRIEKTGE